MESMGWGEGGEPPHIREKEREGENRNNEQRTNEKKRCVEIRGAQTYLKMHLAQCVAAC